MRSRSTWSLTLASLVISASTFVALGRAVPAQQQNPIDPPPFGGDATLTYAGLGGMARPALPQQGDWAEVIMANNKWLVLQNSQGQQFPVSYDSVRQYYVRWPATIAGAAPNALVEVTGVDLGTNQVGADHVDIYENESRALVTPTFLRLSGFNRVYSAIDVMQEQTYGIYFPMLPQEYAIPRRLHAVGPVMNRGPLQIAIEGNNLLSVVPPQAGLTVTQVTLGDVNTAKKGDTVYFVAGQPTPKSLTINQLVLYKTVPYRAFAR